MTTVKAGKMKDTEKAALQKKIAFYSNLLAQHEKLLEASKQNPGSKLIPFASNVHFSKARDRKISGVTKSNQRYHPNVKYLSKNLNVVSQNSSNVPKFNNHKRTVLINEVKNPISKASVIPSNKLYVKPFVKNNTLSWTSSQKSTCDYRKSSSVYNTSIVKGTSSSLSNAAKLQNERSVKNNYNASFTLAMQNSAKNSTESAKNMQPDEQSVSQEKAVDSHLLSEILAITQKLKQTSKTLSPSKTSLLSSSLKLSLLSSSEASSLSSAAKSSLSSFSKTSPPSSFSKTRSPLSSAKACLSSASNQKSIRINDTMCNQSLKSSAKPINVFNRPGVSIVRTLDTIPMVTKPVLKGALSAPLPVIPTSELILKKRPNFQPMSVKKESSVTSTNQNRLFLSNENEKKDSMLVSRMKLNLKQKEQNTILNHKLPCLLEKTLKGSPIITNRAVKRLNLQLASTPIRKTEKNLYVSAKKKSPVAKLIASKYQVVNKKCLFNPAITFKSNNSSLNSLCKSGYESHKWIRQKGLMSKQKQLNSKYKVINEILGSGNKLKLTSPSKLSVKSPKGEKYILKKKLSFEKLQENKSLKTIDKTILFSNLKLSANSQKPLTKLNFKTNKNPAVLNTSRSFNRNLKPHTSVKKQKRRSLSSSKSKYKFVNQSSSSIILNNQSKVSKKLKLSSSKLYNFPKSDIDVDLLLELAAEKGSGNTSIVKTPAQNKQMLLKRVYKSKNTIINKNVHSAQVKTAKMIKSKYFPVNKRHSWKKQAIINKFANPKHIQGRMNKSFQARMGIASFYSQKNMRNRSKLKVPSYANATYCFRRNSKRSLYYQNKNILGSTRANKYFGKFSANHTVLRKTSPYAIKQSTPVSKILASRVLQHSINRALTASLKKKMSKVNIYCMFYNRFGRCNKGTKCPYVHDPSKIAICTRFLRGTCKVENCTFSHEICPGKMAICSFFLSGSCTKADCPYRHEMLTPGSDLCKAFVQGYCSSGKQCKKAHILVCPQYVQGFCSKGDKCAFPHPPPKEKKIISAKAGEKIEHPSDTDEFLMEKVSRYFQPATKKLRPGKAEMSNSSVVPKRRKTLPEQPSFISLSTNDSES